MDENPLHFSYNSVYCHMAINNHVANNIVSYHKKDVKFM